MTSIYLRALGSEFDRLHPSIQERFGFTSADGRSAIGRRTMENVWHGRFYTLPFLYVGTWRNIMFPERGQNIPFTIENWAHRDSYGRETVTWLRTFSTGRRQRFDAYMIYSEQRQRIVDYLGTRQHLGRGPGTFGRRQRRPAAALRGAALLRESPGVPFSAILSGVADVCEWFYDESGRCGIEVNATNSTWGPLFGYRGAFDVEWVEAPGGPPDTVRPKREERWE